MYLTIYHLILKEIRLEFRSKVSLGSLFVYVISTVFVCYRSFLTIQSVPVWNALFWIIVLFSVVNAVSRSFYHEN
jgi:heme exporter protein B